MMHVGQTILSCAYRDCTVAVARDMRAHSLLPHMVERMVNLQQLMWKASPQKSPVSAILLIRWDSPCPIGPFRCCLQYWRGCSTGQVVLEIVTGGSEDDPVHLLA